MGNYLFILLAVDTCVSVMRGYEVINSAKAKAAAKANEIQHR